MKLIQKCATILFAGLVLLAISQTAVAAEGNTVFSDVPAGAWYAESAVWCRDNGIMSGTTNTMFSPDVNMSRAMLATVLYRAAGSPSVSGQPDFTDTAVDEYYADAIVWANGQGVISGYGNGLFGTNNPVTREQLATILWRYAGSPAAESGADYADEVDIAAYAEAAVAWARSNNIISGMDGNRFAPKSGATRAQVAAILHRYLTNETGEPEESGEDSTSGKILIAYFSRTGENYSVGTISMGNTAVVAELIAEQTGGDLFEIVPATPYPSSYQEMLTVATREADEDARPPISSIVSNMDDYDVVFIGYPIWYSDMPMIVYNFLESYDFSGKTVIPFNTHEGSGQAGTQVRIEAKLPNATVLDGLAVRGNTAQNSRTEAAETVRRWLDGLDIPSMIPQV